VKKDRIFLDPEKGATPFEFNAEVAEVFDDMLERSIPFYAHQQTMIVDLCKKLWIPGTLIYDLGCSTATTLIRLSRELPSARLVGYDSSLPMLDRAKRNLEDNHLHARIDLRRGDLNGPSTDLALRDASIAIMGWTLQFVRPDKRYDLVRSIYAALADEGVLIVTEKILTNGAQVDPLFIHLYHEYKRGRGYADAEIARKREALENVLVPYRLEDNLELFRGGGFEVVETFFQWFNFAGFLCVKKPATIKLSKS
jgi:tRNA (cmo5U34)-methyltransferase